MEQARLLTSIVHGSNIKSADISPLVAFRQAVEACGAEKYWFGETDEEKGAIQSYLDMDVKNEKILFSLLESTLSKNSFLASPARETAADVFLYTSLCTRKFEENFQKANPNVARWMNHMQGFVAKATGNPNLVAFRVSALKATIQPVQAQPTSSVPVVSEKKEEKANKKEEKKDNKKEEKSDHKKEETSPPSKEGSSNAPSNEQKETKEKKKKEAAEGEDEPAKKKKEKTQPVQAAAAASAGETEFLPYQLDVRVGKILSAEKLEGSDKLFVEQVDVGEGSPRTILSGLSPYYSSPKDIEGKLVLVVCNLKPRKIAGSESNGMVLATSSADKSTVQVCEAPAGTPPGTKITYSETSGAPEVFAEPTRVEKKKILDTVKAGWISDNDGNLAWKNEVSGAAHLIQVAGITLTSPIKNGTVG